MKRESCASSATTTSLLGPPSGFSYRGSNGALHVYSMPRAVSPIASVIISRTSDNIILANFLFRIFAAGPG